jgi:hypothetical protein
MKPRAEARTRAHTDGLSRLWPALAIGAIGGCVLGTIGDGGEATHGDPDAPPPSLATEARLWRLSHLQYDRTVLDLLDDGSQPATAFEPEASGTGFAGGADVAYVSTRLAEQYMHAAESLVERADVEALLPCSPPDAADTACVQSFIASFGKRAFRQPLSAEQEELYFSLYTKGSPISGEHGLRLVLEAMLQSPYFLYRFELGEPGETGQVVRLTSHEMASQLSYFLWNTMPDAQLMDTADSGALDNRAGVTAELGRLLADERAQHVVWSFVQQYFDLDQVATLQKDEELFSPELRSALVAEAEAFVEHVAWEQKGGLSDLLTASYSFVDDALAEFYGLSAPGSTALELTYFEDGARSGLLTHAGFLAVLADQDSSSPVFRGLFVRKKLLCHEVPDPPANVVDNLEPPSEVVTTRQRYEAHLSDPSCSGCHSYLDPIGFGFEHYDAIGRFRATENGEPVDASGEIIGTREIDGTFVGAAELGQKLASTGEVADCVVSHFFRYALGRRDTSSDAVALAEMRSRFRDADTALLELVAGVVESDAFHYRIKQ